MALIRSYFLFYTYISFRLHMGLKQVTLTKIPHEHVPKSHVITCVITCDFGTCSCTGIFVRSGYSN